MGAGQVAVGAHPGAGMLLLALVPTEGGLGDVLPAMLLFAVGSSLAYAPTFIAASTGVPDADQGAASGLINSMQELGAGGLPGPARLRCEPRHPATNAASLAQLTQGYRVGFLLAAGLLASATLIALRTPRELGRSTAATQGSS